MEEASMIAPCRVKIGCASKTGAEMGRVHFGKTQRRFPWLFLVLFKTFQLNLLPRISIGLARTRKGHGRVPRTNGGVPNVAMTAGQVHGMSVESIISRAIGYGLPSFPSSSLVRWPFWSDSC